MHHTAATVPVGTLSTITGMAIVAQASRFADLKAEADQMLKAADPTTVRSAPTPTRYHNPQTGEVIEWDGQQWKAAQ